MPPVIVEEQRVAHLAGLQPADVARHQRLDERGDGGVVGVGVAARRAEPQERRPHVRDVEEAGVLARPFVLGDDAGRVLHRHGIAGERHHARAGGAVRVGKRRFAKRSFGPELVANGTSDMKDGSASGSNHDPAAPPLSKDLRDFPRRRYRRRGYSFGERARQAPAAFQIVDDRPVLLPESFRGGCSFGAGP